MRSRAAKLGLFKRFFTGRTDVYGTYDPKTGRVWQEKRPVDDGVFLAHLTGHRPYGVYLLQGDRTSAVVVDFDEDDPGPPREFLSRAGEQDIPAYIERSKAKGYHVWVFFGEEGVCAAIARQFATSILGEIARPDTEVFPKQDSLGKGATYGNFINAPLFGALVPTGRTVFVDPEAGMAPFPDQWSFLERVQTVEEPPLGQALSRREPAPPNPVEPKSIGQRRPGSGAEHVRFTPKSSLPVCAQRMLNDGVTENQRVACFRLAVHLNRLGVPFDITIAALRHWAGKNRPAGGKRVITDAEIEQQADSAYKRAYRGFGCDEAAVRPFCSPECPLWWKQHPNGSPRMESGAVRVEGVET